MPFSVESRSFHGDGVFKKYVGVIKIIILEKWNIITLQPHDVFRIDGDNLWVIVIWCVNTYMTTSYKRILNFCIKYFLFVVSGKW